jgi:hypothetical protein
MSSPDSGGEWACERGAYGGGGGVPFTLRVGATGFGAGVGCGVGVGFGSPLNLAGVPVVGSAASGIGAGLGQFRGVIAPVERRLRALLGASRALRGVSVGAGCGVGVGYGFGAGLFLKPSAGEALARRAAAACDALAAKLPVAARQQLQQLHTQAQQQQQQQQHGGGLSAQSPLSAAGAAATQQRGAASTLDADAACLAADAQQSVRTWLAHHACAARSFRIAIAVRRLLPIWRSEWRS